MDKILFFTIVGLFSAFITAVVGFTKLINDKESKVSEFREAWTDTVRHTLAELVSCFRVFFDLIEKSHKIAVKCDELSTELRSMTYDSVEYKTKNEALLHNKVMLEKIGEKLLETKTIIHKNIALTSLHFKPNDNEFQHVESKINSIMTIISDVKYKSEKENKHEKLKIIISKSNEAEIVCREILYLSRNIMKYEWERIKGGEDNYKKTKKLFKNGSLVISVIMAILFLLLVISRYSNYLAVEMVDKSTSQRKLPICGDSSNNNEMAKSNKDSCNENLGSKLEKKIEYNEVNQK